VHGQPIPKAAFTHAAKALEVGPCAADLYHRVAALYATAAKQDPALIQPTIEFVKRAVELGSRPEVFASDIRYSALQGVPAFRDALRIPVAVSKSSRVTQLVDPLDTL